MNGLPVISYKDMRNRDLLVLWLGALLALAGCATDSDARRVRARGEASWPEIRSIAQQEVARHRSDAEFAHRAFYTPESHRDGIWYVVVASVQRRGAYYSFAPGGLHGGYPGNLWQDVVEVSVTDDGEVASYSTHSEHVLRP